MDNSISKTVFKTSELSVILIFSLAILLLSCHEKREIQKKKSATYHVSFTLNWNAQDFPADFPSNAHFSRLIGWSHQPNSDFFKVGTIASEGIKVMAESGKNNSS